MYLIVGGGIKEQQNVNQKDNEIILRERCAGRMNRLFKAKTVYLEWHTLEVMLLSTSRKEIWTYK